MWDRRLFVILCLGSFLSWSYRVALTDLDQDPSSWLAFLTLWLPTAVVLGWAVAFAVPRIMRWLREQRR